MMLHRHFEKERNENMTTLADVAPKPVEDVSYETFEEVFEEEAPKRRGRPRKTE